MKKTIILISALFILFGAMYSTDFLIEFKGGYFSPSDSDFKDFYSGGLILGGEIGLVLSKKFELAGEIFSFTGNGELSYTQEDTELTLLNLGINAKFFLGGSETFSFYLSPGLYYCSFKESSNALGEVTASGLGLRARAGGLVKLSNNFGLDIFAGYSYCEVKPFTDGISVGGLEGGLGLRYTFKKK